MFPDGKRIAPPRETYGLRKENIKCRASFLPTYKGDYKSMIRTLMFSILMMMVTSYTGILYLSSQIGLSHFHHWAMASSDYFYATSWKFGQCTSPHIASQHHGHSVGLQFGSDVRLTSTPLRRRKYLCAWNAVFFIHRKNGVKLTMTEMVVYQTVSCR